MNLLIYSHSVEKIVHSKNVINLYQKGNILTRITGKQREDITHERKVGRGITTEAVEMRGIIREY